MYFSAAVLKVIALATAAARVLRAAALSATGSTPDLIFSRMVRAASRAPASVTSGYPPMPISRRLPPTATRINHDFVPVLETWRTNPETPPTWWYPVPLSRPTSRADNSFVSRAMATLRRTQKINHRRIRRLELVNYKGIGFAVLLNQPPNLPPFDSSYWVILIESM
jgi:hypothetical protein